MQDTLAPPPPKSEQTFTITIVVKKIVAAESGGDWKVIDQAPVDGTDKLKDVYGYTPKITKKAVVEREIFKQTVNELSIPDVIKAINGMD